MPQMFREKSRSDQNIPFSGPKNSIFSDKNFYVNYHARTNNDTTIYISASSSSFLILLDPPSQMSPRRVAIDVALRDVSPMVQKFKNFLGAGPTTIPSGSRRAWLRGRVSKPTFLRDRPTSSLATTTSPETGGGRWVSPPCWPTTPRMPRRPLKGARGLQQ